jgi:hypothetical protein
VHSNGFRIPQKVGLVYNIIFRQFKGGADLALARFTVVKCFFPGPGDTSRTAYTGVNSRNVAAEGKNVFLHFFVVSCENNDYMSHMPAVTRHKKVSWTCSAICVEGM